MLERYMHDPCTAYALAVTSGERVAGPHVRAACKRHLSDLERSDITYDPHKAAHVYEFFETVLCLNGGQYEGVPFRLRDWQFFVLGSLFGWIRNDTGYRRFTTAYIETGKGSGKSPLVAGVGMFGLIADGEPRAEIYAAAVKQDQAKVLFRDAVAMVEYSPELSSRIRLTGGSDPSNLGWRGGFFRPISSEQKGKGQSGPRPHMGILDEIHEHPTNVMIEMFEAGQKNRTQPLTIMITNSGNSKLIPCWEYHSKGAKVAADDLEDDAFFAYICALDDGDDPMTDESCWLKANPSNYAINEHYPALPGDVYLRKQVTSAAGMPSKENIVRRLNFCEWAEGVNPLFTADVWRSVLHPLELEHYRGRSCVMGLDLSSKRDLTALAIVFYDRNSETGAEEFDCIVRYYTPADTLEHRELTDHAPYRRFVDDGHLQAIPGNALDYDWIVHELAEYVDAFDVVEFAFDRWKIDQFIRALDNAGVEYRFENDHGGRGFLMRSHGQGFAGMAPAIDRLEEMVLNGSIRIDANPVTTMCASNTKIDSDPADNRKFNKRLSTGRIDGMVALAMAVNVASTLRDTHAITWGADQAIMVL